MGGSVAYVVVVCGVVWLACSVAIVVAVWNG